jgi:hypothetical protein
MSQYWESDTHSGSPLWINTEVGDLSTNQREMFEENGTSVPPPLQCASPILKVCDGWCGYDLVPRASVVSVLHRLVK